jgi:hypothetical protein
MTTFSHGLDPNLTFALRESSRSTVQFQRAAKPSAVLLSRLRCNWLLGVILAIQPLDFCFSIYRLFERKVSQRAYGGSAAALGLVANWLLKPVKNENSWLLTVRF